MNPQLVNLRIVFFRLHKLYKSANLSYALTTHRATPYLMGVALGVFLYKSRREINIPKVSQSSNWRITKNYKYIPFSDSTMDCMAVVFIPCSPHALVSDPSCRADLPLHSFGRSSLCNFFPVGLVIGPKLGGFCLFHRKWG